MKAIKFRILIEGKFAYWGFIEKNGKFGFIPPPKPTGQINSIKGIQELSRQFTHMYDRLGSALYEGAIIKEIPNGYIGLVEKDEDGNFSVKWNETEYPDWSWGEMFYDKQDRIEVIGDIDRNPGLWKKP